MVGLAESYQKGFQILGWGKCKHCVKQTKHNFLAVSNCVTVTSDLQFLSRDSFVLINSKALHKKGKFQTVTVHVVYRQFIKR